jgi:4-diphosphocytidyl-2-C-methyl-D-erythritol kinase
VKKRGWRHVRTAAKVNLDLRIGARLPDGYHPVETVLQTIDLGDDLAVGPAPRGRLLLEVGGPEAVPAGEENLVLRAARALLEAAGRDARDGRTGLCLRLTKRVPSGAGLGGGSGDAAATLILLNRHLRLELPRRRLLALARGLGADVPFFLTGGLARGTGRGDCVRPLAPLPRLPVLVVVPRLRLSTAKVYRRFDEMALTSAKSGFTMRPPVGGLRRREPVAGLENDLERPVFRRYPALARVKAEFREAGALVAGLSGSGSAVFGVFTKPPSLGGALREWRRRGWEIHRCHTLDESAYHARFR